MGDGVFCCACVSLSLHVVLLKRWFSAQPPVQTVFFLLLFGSLLLLPVMVMWGDVESIQWSELGFWWPLLYLTGFATLATFLLQQWLLQRLTANHLLAASYLSPAIVVMLTTMPRVSLSYQGMFGVALTCLSLALIFRGAFPESVPKKQPQQAFQ